MTNEVYIPGSNVPVSHCYLLTLLLPELSLLTSLLSASHLSQSSGFGVAASAREFVQIPRLGRPVEVS
jgi:hypothetical protein